MVVTRRREIPIAKVVIAEEEIGAVADVLRSGNLREGPQCAAFEQEFAHSVGASVALTASSGTAALQMAYAAILQPGDEILVPSFTFFATAGMVLAVGAIPVFCDVDPDTLTIDVADAERRMTPRTRAIAPVHLFGNPADVSRVRQLAQAYRLAVIWDAAQAHGSLYHDRDVGSYGDAVCYSFYPTKNMTTGEGGMVCTEDEELAHRMRLLRSHGETGKYVHRTLGYNFRMTDMQAALGRVQLRRLGAWVEARRQNAAYLRERLAGTPLLRVQQEQEGGRHSFHQFSVLADARVDRDAVLRRLRQGGVGCAVHYPLGLHQQPVFAQMESISLPVTEEAAGRIFSLPVHPYVSEDDLQYMAERVLEAVDQSASASSP